MNKFIFMGNLTRDFQLDTDKGIAKGAIALDAGIDKEGNARPADFVQLTAFGRTAENLAKFGKKGKRFLFEGRVKSGSYDNKEGKRIYTEDHVIDHWEFASSKSDQDQPSSDPAPAEWANIPDGIDELPFE